MDKVKTNIDPENVSEALLETFKKWIDFSLGIGELGGKMLKAPSGKMAASLRAEYNLEGDVVALYVDPKEAGALENIWVQGHKGFSLKRRMLNSPKTKRSKAGYLYRFIPISDTPKSPAKAYSESAIKNLLSTRDMPQGGVVQINRNLAKMWMANSSRAHYGSSKVRTMSSKPGSARWYIPAMPAFNIQSLLTAALPKNIKGRVILPKKMR